MLLTGALHAFRMELFFALSGFFSHLVFERRGPGGFLRDRSKRLLVPLLVLHVLTNLNTHLWLRRVLPSPLVTLLLGCVSAMALAFMPLEARPFIYFQF